MAIVVHGRNRVVGRPYQSAFLVDLFVVNVESSHGSLVNALLHVARSIVINPGFARIRAYGTLYSDADIGREPSAERLLTYLEQCEAVAIFSSENIDVDRKAILFALKDPKETGDDEGCVVRALYPRPVIFLHAGHENVDIVCVAESADSVVKKLGA